NRGGIRQAMRYNAVAPRHQSAGDCGNAAFHFSGTRDDRSDDRPGRRAASRLGTIATAAGHRIGVRPMREWDACLKPDANPRIWLDSLYWCPLVHRQYYDTATAGRTISPSDRPLKINHWSRK